MNKISAEEALNFINRLDKVAAAVQANHVKWGMSRETAKEVVNNLDLALDAFEKAACGEDALLKRQFVAMKDKVARVLQKDADEVYMATFGAPMAPVQTDGDEPYMGAFSDDQSSAVASGKSTTNVPLAKGH